MMDERATRVIQVPQERWVPRENLEAKELREILVGQGHLDKQEKGEPQDDREIEEQLVKKEQLVDKGPEARLVVVDCKEEWVEPEDEGHLEKWANKVLRVLKGPVDLEVQEENPDNREFKAPQVLTGYRDEREIREVQVPLATQENLV